MTMPRMEILIDQVHGPRLPMSWKVVVVTCSQAFWANSRALRSMTQVVAVNAYRRAA